MHVSRIKCCVNNSEKFFRSQVKFLPLLNQERREHADVRLLVTTHADNKHLFDGKATNKDAFEKIAERFTKASCVLVKQRRGAFKRMGLVTNGTLSSQTEIPNRNFPKVFVNGKRPLPLVGSPPQFPNGFSGKSVIVTFNFQLKFPDVFAKHQWSRWFLQVFVHKFARKQNQIKVNEIITDRTSYGVQ